MKYLICKGAGYSINTKQIITKAGQSDHIPPERELCSHQNDNLPSAVYLTVVQSG
jgi:hypothetical protein